ncbi:MAG: ATP-binding protein [Rhodobacteraceae bacterium]|nr:ATP-binding protein [Paracoccaceae bacterium]MCY4141549.1 ATP-binding protein [Paracoccaceae bacterium]
MAGHMYPRLTLTPRQSFFLLGVRGVGKSTWARRQFPDAPRIDLLDEARYQDYLADPSLFAADLQTATPGSWVVVDEIQRLPNLLNEVHRHIEDRQLKFALLGSSARKLKATGVNLLAGRALHKTMHPLTPGELGGDFDLDTALDTGTIPLVWVAEDRRLVLESYVRLYLHEEIRAEGLVRNLPGFARFLPIAALYHGQVVNISGIARDCGVARTTVQGYLDILEDTLLAFRLPAFQPRLRARERQHPKLYWVDPGLVRAVKKLHGPIAPEERGTLLEGWVLHLLRAHGEEGGLFDELHYWAPHPANQTEVDFLLRLGDKLAAIEVKSQPRYHTGMLKGLRAITELPGMARRVLVYGGERSFRTSDRVDVWSTDHLQQVLSENVFWS